MDVYVESDVSGMGLCRYRKRRSAGGPGCACIAVGGRAEFPHNDQCRIRIAELLQQSEVG